MTITQIISQLYHDEPIDYGLMMKEVQRQTFKTREYKKIILYLVMKIKELQKINKDLIFEKKDFEN